jgi:ABC-type antimicrobial peptide transport system permease subunit
VVGERLPNNRRGGSEVIGVIDDVSFHHPAEPAFPYVFEYFYGSPQLDAVVESDLTTAELQQAIDRLTADGAIEVSWGSLEVQSLRALRNEQIAADRARGFLSIAAALLVVGLAAFGLYGTERYLVAAGRREYAIRAALGAGPAALGRLVMRRGLMLGLPGLVAGGLVAFIAVAWVRSDFLSQDVSPALVTFWAVVGLIVLLLAASLAPAREARRTQPAPMLRDS